MFYNKNLFYSNAEITLEEFSTVVEITKGTGGFTSFYAGLFAPLRCDFSPYSDRLVNLASIQLQPSENIISRLMALADIL